MFLSYSAAMLGPREEAMKNFVPALVTGLAMITLGLSGGAAAQSSAPDRATRVAANPVRHMMAEVLTVNQGAQALTVRSTIRGKETDAVFSVDEVAAPALANLEPGERVWITYVRVYDQLRAQRIEKLPAPSQTQ
jgi:hypothetical protein